MTNDQPIEEQRWRTVEPAQSDQPALAQAEALCDSLRDLSLKANDLISALKRQRRQEKIVARWLRLGSCRGRGVVLELPRRLSAVIRRSFASPDRPATLSPLEP